MYAEVDLKISRFSQGFEDFSIRLNKKKKGKTNFRHLKEKTTAKL